jgi:hypothetical protein
MGIDYSACSIIGVMIPNPYVKVQERGCHHAEKKAKFCPECGKPMYEEQKRQHPIIEVLDDYRSEKTTKLKLIWSTDQGEAYVGFFKGESDGSRSGGARAGLKVDLPDINIQELKSALRKELKELYNENNFGLWTVLYCSY